MEEEKKKKKKIVKLSDILVIIIGIVLILGGLYWQKNEEDDASWSTTARSSESRSSDEEGEMQGEDILIIVGFVISAFGLACIIKRVLDKNENNVEEKTSADTTSKLKELQKMLDDKLISEEEFNKKKKELMDKM